MIKNFIKKLFQIKKGDSMVYWQDLDRKEKIKQLSSQIEIIDKQITDKAVSEEFAINKLLSIAKKQQQILKEF